MKKYVVNTHQGDLNEQSYIILQVVVLPVFHITLSLPLMQLPMFRCHLFVSHFTGRESIIACVLARLAKTVFRTYADSEFLDQSAHAHGPIMASAFRLQNH